MNYLSERSNSSCAFSLVRQYREINLLIGSHPTPVNFQTRKNQVQISVLISESEMKMRTISLGLI